MNIFKKFFLFPINELKALYTPNEKEAPMLNGIRGLSALMIVFYHCFILLFMVLKSKTPDFITNEIPNFLLFLLSFDKGVDIFFLLSAFLITRHLLDEVERKDYIDFFTFYKRRLYRVYPLFFVALCLYCLMYLNHLTLGKIVYNMTFLSNILGYTIIPVGWSLDVEMQFYLIIPLFVYFIHKTKAYFTIPLLIILSIGIRYFIANQIPQEALEISTFKLLTSKHYKSFMHGLYYPTYSRFSTLMVGIVWAYLDKFYKGNIKLNPILSNIILIISLISFTLTMYFPVFHLSFLGPENNIHIIVWHRLLFAIFLVITLILCDFKLVSNKIVKGFLSLKFWRVFSQLSYSIYLFHFPLVALAYVIVFQTTDPKNIVNPSFVHIVLAFIITTILSTYLSIFMFKYIELPFIRKGRRKKSKTNNLILKES